VYKFSPSAIPQNLRYMPAHLIEAMLMLVVGLAALVWIIVQAVRQRSAVAELAAGVAPDAATRRDLAVGLALAASWAAVWVLYAAYTWTAFPGLSTLASVRFYVPAMAAIALLGAWLITRLPRRESLAARRPALCWWCRCSAWASGPSTTRSSGCTSSSRGPPRSETVQLVPPGRAVRRRPRRPSKRREGWGRPVAVQLRERG
jgi:hypothetical protein